MCVACHDRILRRVVRHLACAILVGNYGFQCAGDCGFQCQAHYEIVSRGMARTLNFQHGTTKISWCDVVVVVREVCKDTPPEDLKDELTRVSQAFADKVADWQRMRQIMERVSSGCIDLILDFNGLAMPA